MTKDEAINWIINISADIGKAEHSDLWHYEQALSEIRDMLESAQPERTGRWSGLWSEPDNEEDAIYGEKLNEGDTIYLLGIEGTVRKECGAWGWGSCHYVPWEELEARIPHNNEPAFCHCDNFVSFWELKWNFDDGYDWDGVPFVSHNADTKMEVDHEGGSD